MIQLKPARKFGNSLNLGIFVLGKINKADWRRAFNVFMNMTPTALIVNSLTVFCDSAILTKWFIFSQKIAAKSLTVRLLQEEIYSDVNDNIPVRSIRNIFFRMVNPGEVVLHHATQISRKGLWNPSCNRVEVFLRKYVETTISCTTISVRIYNYHEYTPTKFKTNL